MSGLALLQHAYYPCNNQLPIHTFLEKKPSTKCPHGKGCHYQHLTRPTSTNRSHLSTLPMKKTSKALPTKREPSHLPKH